MTPYRHLLCPVDFSDISRMALAGSLRFAKEVGARLSVLHVVDTGLVSVGNLVAVPDAVADMRRRATEAFTSWEREMDLRAARVEILEGMPEEVIVSVSNGGDVDLLVMGTHGLTGFQKFLLGSVTEKVLHRARVPMMTISPRIREGEIRDFPRPKTILIAIDFGPESESVIRHGVWLAEHHQAKLIAAQAVPIPYVALSDHTIDRLLPDQLQLIEKSLIDERKKKLQDLLPESVGTSVEMAVEIGAPFDFLRSLVRDRSVDLVVMGAGGHGMAPFRWLGSTCHKMVRSAECPVLIVR